jgi:hypothetical protein
LGLKPSKKKWEISKPSSGSHSGWEIENNFEAAHAYLIQKAAEMNLKPVNNGFGLIIWHFPFFQNDEAE